MHPVLFEFPLLGFPVRSFGVLVALGFILGMHVWGRLTRRYGFDPAGDEVRVSAVAMWVLFGVIGGGRAFYVIVEMLRYQASGDVASAGYQYIHEPLSILKVWQGGLVMYGGFFGAMLLGLYGARKHKLHLRNTLDTGLVAGFFGQCIGRIGCLLVGDDFGRVVPLGKEGLPFPITVKVPSLEWLAANPESLFPEQLAVQTLWCTQLWMSFNALMLGLIGLWLLKRRKYFGQSTLVLLVLYAITRFTIESFRGDSLRGLWFDETLSTSQVISIVGGLAALVLLALNRKRRDTFPKPKPDFFTVPPK